MDKLETIFFWIWFIIFLIIIITIPFTSPKFSFNAFCILIIPMIIYIQIDSFIDKKNKKKIKERTITIYDDLGNFSTDPVTDNKFKGYIKWVNSEECGVYLEKDSDDKNTAEKSLNILHTLCENMADWDTKLKEYSAEHSDINAEGMISIWGKSEEEPHFITKAEYIKRMSINFIDIYSDGNLFFMYELDGMFTDHSEFISADISGEIFESTLYG